MAITLSAQRKYAPTNIWTRLMEFASSVLQEQDLTLLIDIHAKQRQFAVAKDGSIRKIDFLVSNVK
jgi:hypothetical protein